MSTFDWHDFLRQWSQEILASMEDRPNQLPIEVIESGWLGYPGATEEHILQTEIRLGTTLPPSYREFLKVTNGWRQITPFIYRIWSIEEVEWFSVRHSLWIEQFISENIEIQRARAQRNNGLGNYQHVSDNEYYTYGAHQDCSKLRTEYLRTALEISDKGESSIYLLNPQVVTESGEWEAWFFGDWLPGADRYRSFQEMMQAEYKNFLELANS
ncbi:MAG: SMI1/KNR4 family protein [Cyanobacteria bacterium P01_H01_bin.21]